jgi:drug/metabolite transporter (DMT)-like permease
MNRFVPPALVILWSSGFVGATLASRSAPAVTTLLWRYVVAAAVLCAWVAWTRRSYGRRFLARQGLIGVLGHGGYCLGVYRAADLGVLPGTSALVASLQPPLVALVLWTASRSSADRRQSLGLLTGLVGVLLVVGGDLGAAGGPAGLVAVGGGTLSLTVATLLAHRWPSPEGHGVVDSLAVQAGATLVLLTAVALASGTAAPPLATDFWLAVAWLVVLPFAGGYACYLHVLRTSGPVAVSAWLYLTPATAALWAWPMFGEPLSASAAAGFTVAAAGVAVVMRARRTSAGAAAPSPGTSPLSPRRSPAEGHP